MCAPFSFSHVLALARARPCSAHVHTQVHVSAYGIYRGCRKLGVSIVPFLCLEGSFNRSPQLLCTHDLADTTLAPPAHFVCAPILCRGRHGTVVRAMGVAARNLVAVKCIPRRSMHPAQLAMELSATSIFQDRRGFLRLYATRLTPTSAYIVMELAQGGDLMTYLQTHGAMPERTAAAVIASIVSALASMHTALFIHRDVKPENVLLPLDFPRCTTGIALADFGLCTHLSGPHQRVFDTVGTLMMNAPEALPPATPAGYSFPVDMWCVACAQPPAIVRARMRSVYSRALRACACTPAALFR